MRKRLGFFSLAALILLYWGGVNFISCKGDSDSGTPNLDLTMYADAKNETEIDSLSWKAGGDAPLFYVKSEGYPNKNQLDHDMTVYGDDEEELDDENVGFNYKKKYQNYKVELKSGFPTEPGTYDFIMTIIADSGVTGDLEFEFKVLTEGGEEVTGAAPKITRQPASGSNAEGVDLLVEATVSNNATIAYQWYKDGVVIPGATTASYRAEETGAYYVTVMANAQTVQSDTANVVIGGNIKIPEIVIQSATSYEIKNGVLKVPTPGDGEIRVKVNTDVGSYQWYKVDEANGNTTAIAGATTANYVPTTFGGYYCKVFVEGNGFESNRVNVVEKDIVMTLTPSFGAESYVDTPLTVIATADVPCAFAYQWYTVEEVSGSSDSISGATSASYVPTKAGYYECKVTPTSLATGKKGSARATEKCYVKTQSAGDPVIPIVSVSAAVPNLKAGETLRLTATVTNSINGTATYQWKKDGNNISGATNATYEKKVTSRDSGSYSCEVTNTLGEKTVTGLSNTVKITVTESGDNTGSGDIGFDFN